jgi:hypothetical protein
MIPTVDRMYSEQEQEILKNMKERGKALTSNKINYCLKYKSPLDVFAVHIYTYIYIYLYYIVNTTVSIHLEQSSL